jgi:REP element-mobilizing transposase RayT
VPATKASSAGLQACRLHPRLHDHESTDAPGGRELCRATTIFHHDLHILPKTNLQGRQRRQKCQSQVLESADSHGFAVVAYCVMPDHVHLLVTAQREDADLGRFVKHAKQVTGFAYRRVTDASLWQPGYHERVLRDEEATLTLARYILENPVRAGLATVLGEWTHAGSAVFTWPELRTAWEQSTHARE